MGGGGVRMCVCVSVCVWGGCIERDGSLCVSERARERVCVCVRERERDLRVERGGVCVYACVCARACLYMHVCACSYTCVCV